ncbi:protein NUCLEAR FUSION DEFECTIVE 4-like [Curcuma longa]|uniref:protein NUCLEAR FUSION DEFECTIVE 4-like n=1 Tax=Curcuma longa TaxID=136217 RepID=UPI003D9DB523
MEIWNVEWKGTSVGRWLGLVTAVWVQCISGNNYTFSNYSGVLKTLMDITQLQLNNLSVAKDIGKAFGIVAGLASDRLPTPIILLIGSLEGLVGYGAQWLVVRQSIRPLPYWQMCIFLCMGGNSTTWMNTAVLVTCIRNFRQNRGPVSGILKGYVGLSTAIFTDICSALFSSDPASFIFLLAVVPAAVCTMAMLFLRESPPEDVAAEDDGDGSQYFAVINAMAVVIAVYLLIFDLTGKHGALVSRAFAVVLLLLLAAPVAVPIHIALKAICRSGGCREADVEDGGVSEPLLAAEAENTEAEGANSGETSGDSAAAEEVVVKEKVERGRRQRPEIGEDHTIVEAVKTVDFWVLFFSFLCGVGTGMAVMNNMGQMGTAMGYTDVSIFVSMLSIWGFFGRIASGSISEYFIKKHATPRPVWNAASQILMAAGYVVMAIGMPGALFIGSVIVGFCYGVRLAVTVPTASELFGLKYYGLVYNILILNLPLGSFLFSGLLAGILYDAEATNTEGGGNTCVGAHCYRMVFVVMALVCLVGFGLDVLLAYRTKQLYGKIHMNKRARNTKVAAPDNH